MSPIGTSPIGAVFGRFIVIAVAPPNRHGHAKWHVRCACGVEKVVLAADVRSGHTASCGCLRREVSAARTTTHRLRAHPLYSTWHNMLRRCQNPGNGSYANYGGRGITACDRWTGPEGFPNFLADMGERLEGLTLERINNDAGYSPENCRWATRSEQRRNQRPARRSTRTHCLSGHGLTPENTYTSPSGNRQCRTCRLAARRRRDANAAGRAA